VRISRPAFDQSGDVTDAAPNKVKTAAFIGVAATMAAVGIYVAYEDDPSLPGLGPAGIGMLLAVKIGDAFAQQAR